MTDNGCSPPALSKREMLAQARQALHALMVGRIKSYQIGRRTITYYSLKELQAYIRELEAEIAQEAEDADHLFGASAAFFDRR